jgi:hypothetical protein
LKRKEKVEFQQLSGGKPMEGLQSADDSEALA